VSLKASDPSDVDDKFLEYIQSTPYIEAIIPLVLPQNCFELLISYVEDPERDPSRDQFCGDVFLPSFNETFRTEVSADDYLGSNEFALQWGKYLETPSESPQALLRLYHLNNDLYWLSVADSYQSMLAQLLVTQLHIRQIIGLRNPRAALEVLQRLVAKMRQSALESAASAVIAARRRSSWGFPGRVARMTRSFLAKREQDILRKSISNFHLEAHAELESLAGTIDSVLNSTWPVIRNVVRAAVVPSLLSISRLDAIQSSHSEDTPQVRQIFEIVSLVGGNSSFSSWPNILRSIRVAITHLETTIPTM